MSITQPTPVDRLHSAVDGIRQVSETLEHDPEKARTLLLALAGNVSWIAEQIEATR